MMKSFSDLNDTLRHGGTDAVRERRDKAPKLRSGGNSGPTNQETQVPVIRLRAGAMHEIASEAEAALIAAGAPLYARGGEIVRSIVEEVAKKYDGRAKKFVPTDPPVDVAKNIVARDGDWNFRRLSGIVTTPTLRPDGSTLAKPGVRREHGIAARG